MSSETAFRRVAKCGLLIVGLVLLSASDAAARIRLENICSIYGQKEVELVGYGLVTGLNGTGDGGKNAPAMRTLAMGLQKLGLPVLSPDELEKAENVAVVIVHAKVPRMGLRRGQKLDCYVTSPFYAEDLTGGRLLVTPLRQISDNNDPGKAIVAALAGGPIIVNGDNELTSGKIQSGVTLEQNFMSEFVDTTRGNVVTLLLDESRATFHGAREVARVVNEHFKFQTKEVDIARPQGPGVIEVKVPDFYLDAPVVFVAELFEISIENPHTEARVVVNPKTETVIVTGEVEISPVVISHHGLRIEIGAPAQQGGQVKTFVPVPPLVDDGTRQSSAQLKNLVEALDQLQVPTGEIIEIIRELHRTGKLHATYIEN